MAERLRLGSQQQRAVCSHVCSTVCAGAWCIKHLYVQIDAHAAVCLRWLRPPPSLSPWDGGRCAALFVCAYVAPLLRSRVWTVSVEPSLADDAWLMMHGLCVEQHIKQSLPAIMMFSSPSPSAPIRRFPARSRIAVWSCGSGQHTTRHPVISVLVDILLHVHVDITIIIKIIKAAHEHSWHLFWSAQKFWSSQSGFISNCVFGFLR